MLLWGGLADKVVPNGTVWYGLNVMERFNFLTSNILSKEFLLNYHIGEEILIALTAISRHISAMRIS